MLKIKMKVPKARPGDATPESPQDTGTSSPLLATRKFKIKQPKQQKLKVMPAVSSSKILLRKSFVGGYGYDSEAEDREDDPTVETHIILRFKSGLEADYVRSQIDAKNPLEALSIKFKDSRNAVVTVQKKLFAARLVDLPTITEVHKSFDKKNVYKVADVCQMLLVGDRISHEDTVLAIPSNPRDFIYPHGLTPPLRNVRARRFRKRASAKTIESVEKEVDRLFSLDASSEQTTYTIMDKDDLEREQSGTPDFKMSLEPDGDREELMEDEEGSDYEDLAADLEAQLNSPAELDFNNTPARPTLAKPAEAPTPMAPSVAVSPDASSEGSDVGSDEDEEVSKEQVVKKSGQKALREGVANLQEVIASKKADIERAINPIMKQRMITTLRKFENELQMKMSELEEAEE